MESSERRSEVSLAEAGRAIEAIVLVSTDPVPGHLLAQLLELSVETVVDLCRGLASSYEVAGHGFQLVEVAGGWRFQTQPDLAPYVERFALDGQSTRTSRAALETLAIVAYKQPISRAQVSAIRGVNVDGVLRTLVQRGYVEEIGRDTGAGQAVLFGTTSYFLERIGVNALTDLPALGDFVPSAEVVEALEQTLRVDLDQPEEGPSAEPAETPTAPTGDGPAGDELDLRTVVASRIATESPASSNGHGERGDADEQQRHVGGNGQQLDVGHNGNGNGSGGDVDLRDPEPAEHDLDLGDEPMPPAP